MGFQMGFQGRWKTRLMIGAMLLSSGGWPIVAVAQSSGVETQLQQAQQLFEAGNLAEAKSKLQPLKQTGDRATQAIVLANLALIAAQEGDWTNADQMIQASQAAISTSDRPDVRAQILSVQGQLNLVQGQTNAAITAWDQAATQYQKIGNVAGVTRNRLRQAQALQILGFHTRALREILIPLHQQLQQQPDSVTKANGLRQLGEALQLVTDTKQARPVLDESLRVAQQVNHPNSIATAQLAIANLGLAKVQTLQRQGSLSLNATNQLQKQIHETANLYTQIANGEGSENNRLRAQLNLLTLRVETGNFDAAIAQLSTLSTQVQALPPSQSNLEARLNLANQWIRLTQKQSLDQSSLLSLLSTTQQHAETLGDRRLLAQAFGSLGQLYEQQQNWALANDFTSRALLVSQTTQAKDLMYRWQAQQGRLLARQGQDTAAIAAYQSAVTTLRSLRGDFLALNPEVQFAFKDSIEPIHRQLVDLLLRTNNNRPTADTLRQARTVIESLQLEEINDFLRANCITAQSKSVEQLQSAQATTFIYPIILPDRLAIIVSSPQQEPTLYLTPVKQTELEQTARELRKDLRNKISLDYQARSQQLYQWLIAPIEANLKPDQTLVFVLDGVLRNIPIAALMKDDQFLIESYSVAVIPSLQLINPQALQTKQLSTLAFGLTEERTVTLSDGQQKVFSKLPFVEPELKTIQTEIPKTQIKLNQQFSLQTFGTLIKQAQTPIVHLATHGQFSSNRDQTFLVAFDSIIDLDQFSNALQLAAARSPIELLVLSACETATGDDRAPLGLAGLALRAGARSTMASLWKVNDDATSKLMGRFYTELDTPNVSKSEALRRAQREILEDPRFRRHPYYWAPFVLFGNWL